MNNICTSYIWLILSTICEVNVKFTLEEAMKTEGGNGGTSKRKTKVGCERHAPAALPQEKTRYPLYKGLGGPQGPSGRMWKI
jgi:hypothetical protein